jgi:hypothetical protein
MHKIKSSSYPDDQDNKMTKREPEARRLNWLTLALVIANFALAFITCLMWHDAKNASDTQIRFTQMDTRAYVGVDSVTFDPTVKVRWEYSNLGKTPAYKVVAYPLCTAEDSSLGYDLGVLDVHRPKIGPTLVSGMSKWDEKDFSPSKTNLDSINRGLLVPCFYANIVYEDIFGHPHFTHLAYRWNFKLKRMEPLLYHNDAN